MRLRTCSHREHKCHGELSLAVCCACDIIIIVCNLPFLGRTLLKLLVYFLRAGFVKSEYQSHKSMSLGMCQLRPSIDTEGKQGSW